MSQPPKSAAIRHIISINDFNREQIVQILNLTAEMGDCRDNRLSGKILGTLFFEPSTRTRLSLETAMLQLGGQTLGFADGMVSSTKKGETLSDSIKVISQYVDILAVRHPHEGAARVAAEVSRVPVINGGDGANQHPTQTFIDLYTIWKSHPDLMDGKKELTVAMVGDLRYGRTVHSLIMALSYFNIRFKLIAPPSLSLPDSYLAFLDSRGLAYEQSTRLEDFVNDVDVLYVTRIQEERFPDPVEFMRVRNTYRITADTLVGVRKGFIIMHPLPRVNEIDRSVDDLEVTAYFAQAAFGVPVRKALLSLLLGAA